MLSSSNEPRQLRRRQSAPAGYVREACRKGTHVPLPAYGAGRLVLGASPAVTAMPSHRSALSVGRTGAIIAGMGRVSRAGRGWACLTFVVEAAW
jgi:hypothetical protein